MDCEIFVREKGNAGGNRGLVMGLGDRRDSKYSYRRFGHFSDGQCHNEFHLTYGRGTMLELEGG